MFCVSVPTCFFGWHFVIEFRIRIVWHGRWTSDIRKCMLCAMFCVYHWTIILLSTQNKRKTFANNKKAFTSLSRSLHYSWRNPHFLGWKWRWCILFCVYYRARNSFYEIQIVSISCWVCSFSHVSIQSFRVRQKKKKTYGNVSMNARQHSQMSRFDPFWWFFICKTSKCSFTFDYIVVFNMNKNSQSTFASAKMCQQEK